MRDYLISDELKEYMAAEKRIIQLEQERSNINMAIDELREGVERMNIVGFDRFIQYMKNKQSVSNIKQ